MGAAFGPAACKSNRYIPFVPQPPRRRYHPTPQYCGGLRHRLGVVGVGGWKHVSMVTTLVRGMDEHAGCVTYHAGNDCWCPGNSPPPSLVSDVPVGFFLSQDYPSHPDHHQTDGPLDDTEPTLTLVGHVGIMACGPLIPSNRPATEVPSLRDT